MSFNCPFFKAIPRKDRLPPLRGIALMIKQESGVKFMKMIRTIHPVGQGAFYTERFYVGSNNVYTFIYDCGSITPFSGRGKLIDSEITQTFYKGENITAIFISHFHEDHINGITKLLNYCNVEYVFLPVLTNESKLLLMAYKDDDDNEILMFIDNPSEYIDNINRETNSETKIIFIEEDNSEKQNNQKDPTEQREEVFVLDKDYRRTGEHIKSGTKITFSYQEIIWEYIPYNLRHNDLYDKIMRECSKHGLYIPNGALLNIDSNKLEEAKEIFNNVIKSNKRNINSMVLYSGSVAPQEWDCNAVINYNFNCILNYYFDIDGYYHRHFKTGCLYMGDYDLTEKDAFELLMKKYCCVENNISLVQVPHHGSKHNFDDRICFEFSYSKVFFISAGEKNRYRHPSSTVIEKIFNSRNCVCLVTENKSSALQFIYHTKEPTEI